MLIRLSKSSHQCRLLTRKKNINKEKHKCDLFSLSGRNKKQPEKWHLYKQDLSVTHKIFSSLWQKFEAFIQNRITNMASLRICEQRKIPYSDDQKWLICYHSELPGRIKKWPEDGEDTQEGCDTNQTLWTKKDYSTAQTLKTKIPTAWLRSRRIAKSHQLPGTPATRHNPNLEHCQHQDPADQ